MNSNKNEQTFITWEQAVKQNQLKPVAEEYEKMLISILHAFAKNTVLQYTNMELYMDALELHQYYRDKDYSKLLFDQTKQIFDQVAEAEIAIAPLKEKMTELAKAVTVAALKDVSDKKDSSKTN